MCAFPISDNCRSSPAPIALLLLAAAAAAASERLERSEMVLDSTRYAIERSARVLRGMTFWGKIRNAFSDDPQVGVGTES